MASRKPGSAPSTSSPVIRISWWVDPTWRATSRTRSVPSSPGKSDAKLNVLKGACDTSAARAAKALLANDPFSHMPTSDGARSWRDVASNNTSLRWVRRTSGGMSSTPSASSAGSHHT